MNKRHSLDGGPGCYRVVAKRACKLQGGTGENGDCVTNSSFLAFILVSRLTHVKEE